MRNASAALINFLNGLGPTSKPFIADLLTIIQKNGTVTRLTSAPSNLSSKSQAISPSDATVYTFVATGPTFSRSRIRIVVGLEVDDLQLTIKTNPLTQTLGGVPWPAAARAGALDGARIVLERLFMPTWADYSLGTLILFSGSTGIARPTRSDVNINVVSDLMLLANKMPRNTYQPTCLHQLYDAGCTLLSATFTVSGVVAAGGTASAFRSNLAQADGYFDLGVVAFTSGALNGQSFPVKSFVNTNGVVTPIVQLPANPANGDTFTIYPGCDKTQATCSGKFSNLAHYRGYNYIPVPETAA